MSSVPQAILMEYSMLKRQCAEQKFQIQKLMARVNELESARQPAEVKEKRALPLTDEQRKAVGERLAAARARKKALAETDPCTE